MSFVSILSRRTKRVILCLWRSMLRGLALSAAASAVMLACLKLFAGRDNMGITDLLAVMGAVFLAAWSVCFIIEVAKYGLKIFHRYDEDIIGGAFTGLDRRSRIFERGVAEFHHGGFKEALEIFTELDSCGLVKSGEDQGVLSFYRGRCYHIMGIFPNAVIQYDKAKDNGFFIPEPPVFIARCCTEAGDTSRALKIYTDMLDTDQVYSCRARCEIGNIYLKLNDGRNALKWFEEAIERRESYAESLGGAAVAYNLLRDFTKGEEYYRLAMLNHVDDPMGFANYYKEVQAAVMLETHYRGDLAEATFKA